MIKMNRFELEDYLKENINNSDFIDKHTRPEFAEILRILYPNAEPLNKLAPLPYSSMCKERQIEHIRHWLKLHGRIKQ